MSLRTVAYWRCDPILDEWLPVCVQCFAGLDTRDPDEERAFARAEAIWGERGNGGL